MATISGAEDAYRILVEESEESWLFGLLAFAIIEERRIEWVQHFRRNNDRGPDETEIQHWYEQQPEGELLRAKAQAEKALEVYANEVWEEFSEQEQRQVAEGALANEIRLVRRFWPQFGISLAGGFVSAFAFAAILAVLAFIVWQDPSAVDIGRDMMRGETQELPSGEENSQ